MYMEISAGNLKTILKEQREEYQRYLGVLSENFESQVKLVAESVIGIQEQLVALREMVARNIEDIVKIQVQLIAIRKMVAKNTEDIEMIKMDLHVIKDDLKEKVSRDEFRILEKRVELVEGKL